MTKVLYIIVQQNFRDEEYLVPKKIFEENKFQITTASITTDEARGMLRAKVKPNIAVRDANSNNFDILVIAGGSGSPKLADYPEVMNIIREFDRQNKPIASICLAGYVLAKSGILKNKKATVFPEDFSIAEYRRQGVNYTDEHVVVDGRIVTADRPEHAEHFANEIVKLLKQ